jgi:hypothetical protein
MFKLSEIGAHQPNIFGIPKFIFLSGQRIRAAQAYVNLCKVLCSLQLLCQMVPAKKVTLLAHAKRHSRGHQFTQPHPKPQSGSEYDLSSSESGNSVAYRDSPAKDVWVDIETVSSKEFHCELNPIEMLWGWGKHSKFNYILLLLNRQVCQNTVPLRM